MVSERVTLSVGPRDSSYTGPSVKVSPPYTPPGPHLLPVTLVSTVIGLR